MLQAARSLLWPGQSGDQSSTSLSGGREPMSRKRKGADSAEPIAKRRCSQVIDLTDERGSVPRHQSSVSAPICIDEEDSLPPPVKQVTIRPKASETTPNLSQPPPPPPPNPVQIAQTDPTKPGKVDKIHLSRTILTKCWSHLRALPPARSIIPHPLDRYDPKSPKLKFSFNAVVASLRSVTVIFDYLKHLSPDQLLAICTASFESQILLLHGAGHQMVTHEALQGERRRLLQDLRESVVRSANRLAKSHNDWDQQEFFEAQQREQLCLRHISHLLEGASPPEITAFSKRSVNMRAKFLTEDPEVQRFEQGALLPGPVHGHPGSMQQRDLIRDTDEFEHFISELETHEVVDANEGINTAQDVADAATAIEATPLADGKFELRGLACTLHPHQVLGIAWMCKRERQNDENGKRSRVRGGLLADAMGLGKTVQAIGVMVKNPPPSFGGSAVRDHEVVTGPRPNLDKPKTTLIVCPVALIHQWAREIATKAPGFFPNVQIHHGATKLRSIRDIRAADVIITSYGTLARDYPVKKHKKKLSDQERFEDEERIERDKGDLFRVKFLRLILDEAHTVKNPAANVSVACCNLEAVRQWCLTGTPLQNKVDDIFPILSILRVPYFSDRVNFRKEVTKNRSGAQKLRGILAPFLKRRNKHDKIAGRLVLTLPEKHVDMKTLTLSEDELALYKQVETQMVDQLNKYLLDGTAVKKLGHIFIMILRLRQLCIHPYLILDHLASIGEGDEYGAAIKSEDFRSLANLFSLGFRDPSNALICGTCSMEAVSPVISRKCRHLFCAGCAASFLEDEESECPVCQSPLGTMAQYDARTDQAAIICAEETEADRAPNAARLPLASAINQNNMLLPHPMTTQPSLQILTGRNHQLVPLPGMGAAAAAAAQNTNPVQSFVSNDEVLKVKNGIKPLLIDSESESEFEPTKPSSFSILLDESEDEELPELSLQGVIGNRTPVKSRPDVLPKREEETEPNLGSAIVDQVDTKPTIEQTPQPLTRSSAADTEMDSKPSPLNLYTPRQSSALVQSAPKPSPRYRVAPCDMKDDEGPGTTAEERRAEKRSWQELLSRDLLPSTKLTAVETQLESWMYADGSKLIVFSQFVKALDLVAKVCASHDWPVLRYQGDMNMWEREATIADFERPEGPRVLLMSLKAGGVGLNLVCASKVLLLDFWWNAAAEHQAIDRVHRMGQVKEVVVTRTYLPGTVEEKILALQEEKLKTAGMVLGESETGTRMAKLGLRDLMGLFGRVVRNADGVDQIALR